MPWPLRLLALLLVVMLLVLQYRLWVGRGSLAEVASLERQIERQRARIAEMEERNALLRAEVESLKHGLDAIEARARRDLGMIKEGETFYQVVPAGEGE